MEIYWDKNFTTAFRRCPRCSVDVIKMNNEKSYEDMKAVDCQLIAINLRLAERPNKKQLKRLNGIF